MRPCLCLPLSYILQGFDSSLAPARRLDPDLSSCWPCPDLLPLPIVIGFTEGGGRGGRAGHGSLPGLLIASSRKQERQRGRGNGQGGREGSPERWSYPLVSGRW